MSLIPYTVPSARWGARMNHVDMVDLVVFDGLFEIFYGYHMGMTAENIAKLYKISRQEQDELGVMSHQRAKKAIASMRELNLDIQKTNPLGSGISIGHPIGCTGARIILTMMGEMIRNDHALGLATLCIGGGQGMAMVLEKM